MNYFAGEYDVAVVGAGHAGIEAALAAARLGCKTAIFTINMDAVGNCPCNPSIGGTAKGHLVREIDALGGEMGKTADECFLQSRMLNRGKGPAVHSLRAQIDRRKYSSVMKHKIELQKNLDLRQAEITDIEKTEGGYNLTTRMLAVFKCKTVIIATGTYLGGRIFVGEVSYESGPDGIFPAAFLGSSLKKLGLPLRRFKTGTPARVLKSSIDFSELEVQKGDELPSRSLMKLRISVKTRLNAMSVGRMTKQSRLFLKISTVLRFMPAKLRVLVPVIVQALKIRLCVLRISQDISFLLSRADLIPRKCIFRE